MSQPPQYQPPSPPPYPPTPGPPYGDPNAFGMPPKVPGIATAALVLGLVGMVICPPVGIVGLVLGIFALVKINRNPMAFGGKGFAITGIVTGALSLIVFPLLIALFLPLMGHSRELANRSTCAANLAGIGKSMILYAGEGSGYYPYLITQGETTPAAKTAIDQNGGGVMFSMFYLVGSGQTGPKQFICKSDSANVTTSNSPVASASYPGYTPAYWNWNIKPTAATASDLCYSYSFAQPFAASNAVGSWWKDNTDSSLPIGADLNPGPNLLSGKTNYNSMNHQGDGQNVVFGDAHVEFTRSPAIGEAGDNIYNYNARANAPGAVDNASLFPPAANDAPGSYDICLWPNAADATTFTRQ